MVFFSDQLVESLLNTEISAEHPGLVNLPYELWDSIFCYATEVPGAHDTSFHDPFLSHHLLHPLHPSGPFVGDHSMSMITKRSLVQVCRLWRSIATRHLYETIVLRTEEDVRLLTRSLERDEVEDPLGRFIVRLDIDSWSTNLEVTYILDRAVNLKIFNVISHPAFDTNGGGIYWPSLFHCTEQPTLRAFIIPLLSSEPHPAKSCFSDFLCKFPRLDILNGLRFSSTPFEPDTNPPHMTFHTFGARLNHIHVDAARNNDGIWQDGYVRAPPLRHFLVNVSNPPLVVPGVENMSYTAFLTPYLREIYSSHYSHLTQITIDTVCYPHPPVLPNLERAMITNSEGRHQRLKLVINLIQQISRNTNKAELVVRIMEGHGLGRYRGIDWLWTDYGVYNEKLAARQTRERERWNKFLSSMEQNRVRVEDYNGVTLAPDPVMLAEMLAAYPIGEIDEDL